MGKEQEGNLSSFLCYNCNERNYFDSASFLDQNESEMPPAKGKGGTRFKEVTIECKSCRESNNVTIEY
jgi:hypothetical protein